MKISKIVFLGLSLFACTLAYSQPYAIPEDALGFAKNVRGAYEGSLSPTILTVDRLTDDMSNDGDAKGSLRWCLTRNYSRIILFEVSGYINLSTSLRVENDYVSIYGQTAPSPGITVSGVDVIDFRCNYVVLQHLRFRSKYDGSSQIDALTVLRGSNVFIDHCSFSYAEDECLGIGGSTGTFKGPLTVQNCIFYQGLNYNHSKGLLLGGLFDSTTVARSAFVHCADRTPFPGDDNYTSFEVLNTLSYNCAYFGMSFSKSNAAKVHVIGNEWRIGPNSSGQRQVVRIRTAMDDDAQFYLYDNYSPKRVGNSEWNGVVYYEGGGRDSSDFKSESKFPGYEENYYSVSSLDENLKASSGARPWDRDSVDIIALNDMVNGTGHWITNQSEAYFPKLAENKVELDVPDSPHADSGNGYTNLEMWVFNMADKIYTGSNSIKYRDEELFLYPNPVKDLLFVKGRPNSSYSIYNINGQLMCSAIMGPGDVGIDVSAYKPGIYFARIEGVKNRCSLKFIKQ